MKVSEVFVSIQGEGIRQGLPAVFLRTSTCNIKCRWCDTRYAWAEGKGLLPSTVASCINKMMDNANCYNLCITGGEPLLQESQITEMLRYLPKADFLSVETNCTFTPCFELLAKVDLWSVSPKLRSSGETYSRETFEYFNILADGVQFKFVVVDECDIAELKEILRDGIVHPVIVQPNGNVETLEEYQKNLEWLVSRVLKDEMPVRVMCQLHRVIWGRRRGV